MKTKQNGRRLGLACLASMLTGWHAGALADDRLDFDITGEITASCGLDHDRIRIDLGSVAYAELARIGAGSPWRRAGFLGVDCVGATHARVTMRASPSAADPRLIAPAGSARGVAIEMRTADGQAVVPDGTSPVTFAWEAGLPALVFEARYVRVGPLGPGDAPATAVIQISWE